MHGRVTCRGHGCFKSSLMHNGRTHECTLGQKHNKWPKYAWVGLLHLFRGNCSGEASARKHSLGPSFRHFRNIEPDWSRYLWLELDMHIIIFIAIFVHFRQGKKITLGLMEVGQKLSLDWFMINAEHIRTVLRPLEALCCKKCFGQLNI